MKMEDIDKIADTKNIMKFDIEKQYSSYLNKLLS